MRDVLKTASDSLDDTDRTIFRVKIGGARRRLNVPAGEGATLTQNYVTKGWANSWCCDSCPDWGGLTAIGD